MSVRALVGVGLLLAVGAGLLLLPDEAAPPVRTPSTGTGGGTAAAGLADGSPAACAGCHAEVVAEWRASMHALAFLDPQVRAPEQADDFRKTECLPCHASAPVFAYGIDEGTRVLARTERRQDGIDCLACHALPAGGVAASREGLSGACAPRFDARLASQALCAPCHNQHGTHDEWRASPAAARGEDCLDCHMPRVTRGSGEAGAPRAGRSHRFPGGRDREFALPGLELRHEVDRQEGVLTVTLHNAFSGHNLPTDSRNRALDLVVTLYDARGGELPRLDPDGRHPGGETGTARLRFRNPYRSSGDPSTQLPAGEAAALPVPLPEEAARATIELFYKLEPWIPDAAAHWTTRVDVEL